MKYRTVTLGILTCLLVFTANAFADGQIYNPKNYKGFFYGNFHVVFEMKTTQGLDIKEFDLCLKDPGNTPQPENPCKITILVDTEKEFTSSMKCPDKAYIIRWRVVAKNVTQHTDSLNDNGWKIRNTQTYLGPCK